MVNKVRAENDQLRTTLANNDRQRVVTTASVAEDPRVSEIVEAVRSFDGFTSFNDPYGEHDFGEVVVAGQRYFWKIDYYDTDFKCGADPYEGEVCRVLTIMRSDEY